MDDFRHYFFSPAISLCQKFDKGLRKAKPWGYLVPRKGEICSACKTRSTERSGAVIFSLSFFFCIAYGLFQWAGSLFPSLLFSAVIFLLNTTTPRPCHRCLPPLRHCHRHTLPLAPPAAYCITVATIGLPPLRCHRWTAIKLLPLHPPHRRPCT
jgi:hypothetical protein